MAVAFVQTLGTAQSKTAGASLAITVASLTVTAGNDIFVAFASDDVGTAHSVTDNLVNTYTLEKEQVNAGNVKSQLWRATGITGGTLTSITISWTTNVTAKAAVAGEFSGVGTQDGTYGSGGTGTGSPVVNAFTVPWQIDDLVIGTGGWEGPAEDALGASSTSSTWSAGPAEVAQDGTTGAGAASNIVVNLVYGIASSNESSATDSLQTTNTASRDVASAGAVYSPEAVVFVPRHPAHDHGSITNY